MDNVWTTVDKHCRLVPENRKLVCDIYGFTTIIITNQHKTYRHPPNTHHTYTSYSPPANCLLTRQPATQAANQASKPSQAKPRTFHCKPASQTSQLTSQVLTIRVVISYLLTSYFITQSGKPASTAAARQPQQLATAQQHASIY